jgi:hypothetical protein
MSPEFQAIFDESIHVVAATPDEPTVIEALTAIQNFIRGMRNIIVDRHDFFTRRQQPGESFEHFFVALRQLGRQAAICDQCLDTQLITLITVGVQDNELQKKLLELRPAPDLNQVLTVCRAFESASADQEKTLINSRYAGTNSNRTRQQKQPSKPRDKTAYDNCIWCAEKAHKDRSECPAQGKTCGYCHKKNHFEKACLLRQKDEQRQKSDLPDKKVGTATISRAETGEWNRSIPILLHTSKKNAKLMAFPDTGADINILPMKLLPKIGISKHDLKPADVTITAYNGERDSPVGFFEAKLTVGDSTLTTKIYVQQGTQQFLLSGKTSEQLGIVSFPLHNDVQVSTCLTVQDIIRTVSDEPSPEVIQQIHDQILTDFSDVFSDENVLKPMHGQPMMIHLKPNAKPFALTAARQIAFSLREKVKLELHAMESKGIIERVGDEASEWCHPMVVVKKPDGQVRICIDYTKLNCHVARPIHPMRTPKDAVDAIRPGDKFYTKMDAVQSYWQIELDPASKHLTTFITPEGRFRFLRAPMGLNATGDEYNRRSDMALAGLTNVQKVVDDILVHSQTFKQHIETVISVLRRCREHGITLSKKKFVFCNQQVQFAGYGVSVTGIAADDSKISAITKFPVPSNITELRSFLGLVNQLGSFSKDISSAAAPLRPLLKKHNVFSWTRDHDIAFEQTKIALAQPPVLQPFDASIPTVLQTDASRTKGLGYALLQKQADDKMVLIQCGSRFLTDAESRYAMVELELLAVVWAMDKCRLYLLGLPHFDLIVDHRPLIPIINSKGLDEIDNPRILRLREKLLPFSFHAEWKRGKDHIIPDALSRAPATDPDDHDKHLESLLTKDLDVRVNYMAARLRDEDDYTDNTKDLLVQQLAAAAKLDTDYQHLITLIKEGFPAKSTALPRELQPYFKLRDDLTVHDDLILFQTRILVPKSERRNVLHRLHLAHQGIERTKRRARQTVYWPGLQSDITNIVGACSKCQENRPSLPAEKKKVDALPTRPFQETAADIFEYAGRFYLVYTDRFSGWAEICQYNKCPNSEMVIASLRKYFTMFGVPNKFRSDGGLQFASEATRKFMHNWSVNNVFSAPHFPSSNGLAEAAVKSMKALVAASTTNGDISCESFLQGLLELRNTPRANGLSPAEMVFGAPLRACVPTHPIVFAKRWTELADKQDEAASSPTDLPSRQLTALHVGDNCWVQNTITRRWSSIGVIVQARHRNYTIKLPSGRLIWRNRRHVRPCVASDTEQPSETPPTPVPATVRPRRSVRLRTVDDT